MKLIALVTCLIASVCLSNALPHMSFEAMNTLLNLEANVTITALNGNTVPIYRKDLHPEYVAYWEIVINNEEFVIVSAGPVTRDYHVVFQGARPTYTSQLKVNSQNRCVKYFMVDVTVTLVCEDQRGIIVASTTEDSNIASLSGIVSSIVVEKTDAMTELLTNELETSASSDNVPINAKDTSGIFAGNLDKLKRIITGGKIDEPPLSTEEDTVVEFQERAAQVAKEYIWLDVSSPVTLSTGDAVKLPVEDSAMIVSVRNSNHDDVCVMTRVCDPKKPNHINKDVIKTTSYGVKYIEFQPNKLLDSNKVVNFQIIIQWKKSKIIRRYQFEQVGHRYRRASSWSYKSIPCHTYFPDYNQFKDGKCQVGCGPVAWASVFGYLDRRAHHCGHNAHCKKLYRSGSDGRSGSNSQIAPKHNDARMKKYISKLHKTLKTFCVFKSGATWAKNMNKVKSFYAARVPGGKVHLHKGILSTLVGKYKTKYRNYAIKYINKGFPAIIGWKVSGAFSQHYPMVTRYRYRTKTVKKCTGFWLGKKCKNVKVKEYQFYLHLGWGGSKNGWYSAKAYMTAAATY